MLNLTVLRKYREDRRMPIVKLIGRMEFNYKNGKILKATCVNTSKIFNTRYSYEKKVIYNAFSRHKSIEKALKKIRKIDIKIKKVEFSDDFSKVNVELLIDETVL